MIEWFNRLEVDSSNFYGCNKHHGRRRRNLYKEIKRLKCDTNDCCNEFATLETLMENNDKRPEEKKVPVDVIMNMYKTIQVPRIGADCDEIGATGELFSQDIQCIQLMKFFALSSAKLERTIQN